MVFQLSGLEIKIKTDFCHLGKNYLDLSIYSGKVRALASYNATVLLGDILFSAHDHCAYTFQL